MAVRADGQIKTSSDCITWVDKTSLPSNSQGYYFGHLYYNGNWIARNRNNPTILYRSTDGSNWTEINSNIQNGDASWLEPYLVYGSNLVMILKTDSINNWNSDKFYTSTDNTLSSFATHDMIWPYDDFGSICYANGNFIACKRRAPIQFAYGTYHDGVMWIYKGYKYSREINLTAYWSYVTEGKVLNVETSNFTVTSIKGTYVEIVKKYEKVIEYKKIRKPKMSQYIDYSTDPYTTYVAKGRSDNSFFNTSNNGWYYDEKRGFYVNSSSAGYHTQIHFDIHGDYNSLTYSDDKYEIAHLSADGWLTYDNKKAKQYHTSGLSRTYTLFENFVNGLSNGSSWNWNDYNNGAPGSISLMMQTMTIPVNAALWAGADGETLYGYNWQSALNATYGRVFRTYNATEAVREVTKSACAKLKSDWGNNLRVYIIKYRKQAQYKHPITGEAVDFDYDYLDDCASPRNTDSVYDEEITDAEEVQKNKYIYDISADTASDAKEKLDKALTAIAEDIKKWAGYEEAKNVN